MITTKPKDICAKRNLFCECEQCREYWQSLLEEILEDERKSNASIKAIDYETEKELDKFFEKDGW